MRSAPAVQDRSTKPLALSQLRLGIACPMANEAADCVRFVQEVLRFCAEFREVTFFVVLDNATQDNTPDLLRDFARTEARLQVIWAPENRSVVDAYVRGYRAALDAGCDWILEVDAGFSHQPEDLPVFFDAIQQGRYDCIFGCRFMPGSDFERGSLARYIVSRGGTWLTNAVLGTHQKDMTSGFQLFSRAALEMVLERGLDSRRQFFQTEIKVYCRNLRIVEVPIRYRNPSARTGPSAVRESFQQLWRLRKLIRAGKI